GDRAAAAQGVVPRVEQAGRIGVVEPAVLDHDGTFSRNRGPSRRGPTTEQPSATSLIIGGRGGHARSDGGPEDADKIPLSLAAGSGYGPRPEVAGASVGLPRFPEEWTPA